MSFLARAAGIRAPALKSTKAPSGALATTQGWSRVDYPLPDPYNNDEVIKKVYHGNVYANRCVDAISNSIVARPWRAGDPVTNNYKLDTPLARLLGPAPGGPNPNWSSAGLLRYAITSYMLMGKFVWLIEKDAVGRVVGLWPLRAQHLQAIPAKSGSDYFKKFTYNTKGNDNYKEYRPDELVYIWKPSLTDFRMCESPVNAAGLNINIAKMIDKFDYNFLMNGGVPANLVITPPFGSPDEKASFQQQFVADFGGSGNAGKTMFVEREIEEGEGAAIDTVDVKILGTNQRDSEINTMRKAENMAICLAFGVPMSILGDSTAVTFSNAFQDRRNYWLETLLPRTREIQDGINTWLAPQLDDKVVGWFDTSDVPELRGDPAIPDAQAVAWVDAGLITADEVRADRGLPPGKDVGLDKVWAEKEKQKALAQKAAMNPQPAANSLIKQAGADGAVAPQKAPVASAPAASRHRGPEGHQSIPSGHVTIAVLEDVLTSQVRNLLEEQATSVRQRVTGRRGRSGVVFDSTYWIPRTKSYLETSLHALGYDDTDQIARSITAETQKQIGACASEYPADGTSEGLATSIEAVLRARSDAISAAFVSRDSVTVASVSDTLIKMSSGEIDVDQALASLGANYDEA